GSRALRLLGDLGRWRPRESSDDRRGRQRAGGEKGRREARDEAGPSKAVQGRHQRHPHATPYTNTETFYGPNLTSQLPVSLGGAGCFAHACRDGNTPRSPTYPAPVR